MFDVICCVWCSILWIPLMFDVICCVWSLMLYYVVFDVICCVWRSILWIPLINYGHLSLIKLWASSLIKLWALFVWISVSFCFVSILENGVFCFAETCEGPITNNTQPTTNSQQQTANHKDEEEVEPRNKLGKLP